MGGSQSETKRNKWESHVIEHAHGQKRMTRLVGTSIDSVNISPRPRANLLGKREQLTAGCLVFRIYSKRYREVRMGRHNLTLTTGQHTSTPILLGRWVELPQQVSVPSIAEIMSFIQGNSVSRPEFFELKRL
jgi:hypothetical protein